MILSSADVLVRIGSYTNRPPASEGIVTARVAADGSRIERIGVTPAEDPSYLAAAGPLLYAVGETSRGTLAAFRAAGDSMEALNVVGSDGAEPCYLAVAGGFLVAANYRSGSIVVRRLNADGGIGERTCLIQHTGHGPVADRQDGPHVHMTAPDPRDDRIVLVTDLGADAVCAYWMDPLAGELTLASRLAMSPGAGPRHLAFHPAEPFVYVLCELDSTLVTCAWDRAAGKLIPLARSFAGAGDCSAIRVSPDGRFLYTACRGPDTITVFSLADAAAPECVAEAATGGASPRDFVLAASGRLLLCANQESGTVTVLRVNPDTGVPARTAATLATPGSVCIVPAS